MFTQLCEIVIIFLMYKQNKSRLAVPYARDGTGTGIQPGRTGICSSIPVLPQPYAEFGSICLCLFVFL